MALGLYYSFQRKKMASQRRQNQLRRQRNLNRIYRRYIRVNVNNGTLRLIANIPQQTMNDPLIAQFFNGFSFP
ncbi:hypothetical protein C1645_812172 [Glomus cerebriforme]|uniref:Uncharacterized protein n=1 Tax=Glomus cerebriforme TaxID=658196 RepID=A0A397TVG8_9GLOM|nr:hypothetical protein C1645_812172 [Glomus cerebriforme]